MKKRQVRWLGLSWVLVVGAGTAWYVSHYGVKGAGDLGTVVGLFATALSVPTALYAMSVRRSKPSGDDVSPELLADWLAEAVKHQWEGKVDLRLLPVAWTAAEPDLVTDWIRLRELAELHWPGGPPGDPARWAQGPEGLAGSGNEISQVLRERVPTRRLVVLGEPGSGKTVLLVRLILDWLENRRHGKPVPYLFSLASWNPRQDLRTWMADQLIRDHRDLREPLPTGLERPKPSTRADALLAHGLVLPVLDGFDELPEEVHLKALDAINQAFPLGRPLVLSSHTDKYRAALTRSDVGVTPLNGAAGIRLLPVDPKEAASYLRNYASGEGTTGVSRWSRVLSLLGTDAPVAQALSTPLGLFLADAIYNPGPGERYSNLPDPDELLDPARFPDVAAVEAYLFGAFIPAVYRPDQEHPPRWTHRQAECTFRFLASHLERTRGGTPHLAWWELQNSLPKNRLGQVLGYSAGLLVGLSSGLAVAGGTVERVTQAVLFGLMARVAVGLFLRSPAYTRDRDPGVRVSWTPRGKKTPGRLWGPVGGALGAGTVAAVNAGPLVGLGVALGSGTFLWLLVGVGSVPPDPTTVMGPLRLLAQDRRTFWIVALLAGGAIGLGTALLISLKSAGESGLSRPADWAFVLFWMLVGGLAFGISLSVWWRLALVRFALAVVRKTPWRLMGFLADAHEHRGVLRQVGSVYQFRHINLQRHLSRQEPCPAQRRARSTNSSKG